MSGKLGQPAFARGSLQWVSQHPSIASTGKGQIQKVQSDIKVTKEETLKSGLDAKPHVDAVHVVIQTLREHICSLTHPIIPSDTMCNFAEMHAHEVMWSS